MDETIESQAVEGAENVAAPVVTEVVKPVVVDKAGSKFAALARKEQAVKQREKEFESQRLAFEKERQTWQESQKAQPDYKAQFLANPIKWAEDHGVSYPDLIKMGLNNSEPTPEMIYDRKFKELDEKYETKLKELTAKEQEKELKAEQDKMDAWKSSQLSDIQTFIESHADEYELTKLHGDYESVFETCLAYAKEHGVEPDMAEAAKTVEAYYEEQVSKIAEAKKLKSRFTQVAPVTPSQTAPTLSNAAAASAPLSYDGKAQLTRDEQIKRAAELLSWEAPN